MKLRQAKKIIKLGLVGGQMCRDRTWRRACARFKPRAFCEFLEDEIGGGFLWNVVRSLGSVDGVG